MKIVIKKEKNEKNNQETFRLEKTVDQVLTVMQISQIIFGLNQKKQQLDKEYESINKRSMEDIDSDIKQSIESTETAISDLKMKLATQETRLKIMKQKTPDILKNEALISIKSELKHVNNELSCIEKEIKRNHLTVPDYLSVINKVKNESKNETKN